MVSRRFGKKAKDRTKKSGFVYKKRSVKDIKERAERKGSGLFDSIVKPGFDTWRPKEGSNLIRFLPPSWDDHKHYGYTIWVHSRIGASESTYLCPQKMLNKRCPVCEAANDERKHGDEEEAKKLLPKEQTAYYIIDRDDDNPHPKIYTVGWMQDREIVNQCYSDRTGKALFIDHPTEGYDITVKRTGKMLQTRYSFVVDREQTPILDNEDEQEEMLEFIKENPIPSVLKYYDPAYLEKVIEGKVDKDQDEDEEDEDDEKVTRAAAKRRKKIEEPEDEDEDGDEDEEDEDEEDEKPVRRRKVKEEPEDEEEDEDEDEEEEDEDEEDEKPVRRRGAKPVKKKRPDPEDEDEDEEEEDEEEEDEKPVRRGAAKPTKKKRPEPEEEDEDEEDEDEDEEDEDEEEEEEKPVRRRSVPAKKKAPPAKREKPTARPTRGRTSRR